MSDIDIDVSDRKAFLAGVRHVRAMRRDGNREVPHPCGVYLVDMPRNPFTGLAAIPYDSPQAKAYPKLDVFGSAILGAYRDRGEMTAVLRRRQPWEAFEDPAIVRNLPHIGRHAELVRRMRPCSIHELAAVLALVRPAARNLRTLPRHQALRRAFEDTGDGYRFRRSHAHAYALMVLLALDLVLRGRLPSAGAAKDRAGS